MQRVLSTVTILGLLIATAAAFAITEHLKLVKSPVYSTFVSKTLSPVCGCARGKAVIRFKLRQSGDVTVTILDRHGDVVATLAAGEHLRAGIARFVWRGTTDAGGRAPDGVYQPEIHLTHRTILMPNRIVLDTRPPKVLAAKQSRTTISPDGDHRADSVSIRYRLSEPAHAVVYLGSRVVVRTRSHKPQGTATWYGRVDGKTVRAGTYTLEVGAVDVAGNVTPVAERQPITVVVRFIELAQSRIVARAGSLVRVRVRTDAASYWWKFAGRHGVATHKVLSLRVPRKAGSYALAVGERRYSARAVVIVGRKR